MCFIRSGVPIVCLYRLVVLLVWLLGVVSGELLIYHNNGNSNSKSNLKPLHNEAIMEGGILRDPFTKTIFEAVAPLDRDAFANRKKRSQSNTDLMDNDFKEANFASHEKMTGKHEHRIRRAPCHGMYGGGGAGGGGGGGTGGGLNGGGSIGTGAGDVDFDAGGIAPGRRRLARRMSRRMSRKMKRKKFTSDNNELAPVLDRRKRQTEQGDLNSETNSAVKTITNYYRQFGERMQSAWKGLKDKMSDLTSSMTDKFN